MTTQLDIEFPETEEPVMVTALLATDATITTDSGITTDSVGLFRTSARAGEPWDEVGRVDLTDPVPGTGSLACADQSAYWATMNQPGGVLVSFDLASGSGSQLSSLWSDDRTTSVALCSGDDDVVLSGISPDRRTARYRLLSDASPEPPDDEATSEGTFSAPPEACPAGNGVVDTSQVFAASGEPVVVQ